MTRPERLSPGVRITAKNANTGILRTAVSGPTGRYEVPNLPVGSYEVGASMQGFQTSVRSGIELTVRRNAVVDVALQVGEVTQAITITGEAPLIETTTATVASLVQTKQVLDLDICSSLCGFSSKLFRGRATLNAQ